MARKQKPLIPNTADILDGLVPRHGVKYKDKSFGIYCKEVWGWHRSYAYRQISAADVVDVLSPFGDKNSFTEGLVRPLTKLKSKDEQISCFLEAQTQATAEQRPVAARHVSRVVKDHLWQAQRITRSPFGERR